jgi:hypothetical protein
MKASAGHPNPRADRVLGGTSPQFFIAGLDPAIHLSSKKMDTRVKPAYDDR